MRPLANDWRLLLGIAAAAGLAASGLFCWRRWRAPDPEEIERQRRSRLNKVGRIAEGHVMEITEAPAPPALSGSLLGLGRKKSSGYTSRRRNLIWYSYSISGVTYETAQDVTGLEERVCLHRLAAGQAASVKYDPANPSNSILVADDWSGVH